MTPSETETLKMFDEQFEIWKTTDHGAKLENFPENHLNLAVRVKDFLLTQIRLARADERKQAYEDGKNAERDNLGKQVVGIIIGNTEDGSRVKAIIKLFNITAG